MKMWKRWVACISYYTLELGCLICCIGDPPTLGPLVAIVALLVGLGTTFTLAAFDVGWVLNPYWDPS